MTKAAADICPADGLREPILETFRRNDPNGDGRINAEQLASVLTALGLGESQLQDLLNAAAVQWPDGDMPFEDLVNWVFDFRDDEGAPMVKMKSCLSADGEIFRGERVMMMVTTYGEDVMSPGTVTGIAEEDKVTIEMDDGGNWEGPAKYIHRLPQEPPQLEASPKEEEE